VCIEPRFKRYLLRGLSVRRGQACEAAGWLSLLQCEALQSSSIMVETTAVAGASLGVLIQMFANSILRLPLTRYPYKHVAMGAAGFYFLPWYDKKVEEAKVVVKEKQREKMERNVTFET
jgi:hypothetical protein